MPKLLMKTKAIFAASILIIISFINYFIHNASDSFVEEITLFFFTAFIALTYLLFNNYFIKPLYALKLTATQSSGDAYNLAENPINNDFDICTSAINHLSLQIKTATEFI